jgi:hypothetical protein
VCHQVPAACGGYRAAERTVNEIEILEKLAANYALLLDGKPPSRPMKCWLQVRLTVV